MHQSCGFLPALLLVLFVPPSSARIARVALNLAAHTASYDLGQPNEEAREASSNVESLPSADLLILVPSHAQQEAADRQIVRRTWAQYLNTSAVDCTPCQNHTVLLVFVVGQEGNATALAEEKERYKDLGVLEDYNETADDQHEAEMMQRSIRYAVENYKFKLLLKVDVHSWVFVDRVLSYVVSQRLLTRNVTLPGVYAGSFAAEPPTPTSQASLGSMPPFSYAAGGPFLLTPDLCEFIAGMGAATEDTSGAPKWGKEYGWAAVPRLISLPSAEMAVGFWLQVVNHTKVSMRIATGMEACVSSDGKSVLVDTGLKPLEMEHRWSGLVDKDNLCYFEQHETESAKAKGSKITSKLRGTALHSFGHAAVRN